MIGMRRWMGNAGEPDGLDALDPVLRQSLGHFKASVHAWSQAMENQPRAVHPVRHRVWRLAAGWALAALLLTGGVSGVLVERHHQLEQARIAAEQKAEQQRELAAQQKARAEEDLLAKVESDISREVPTAMEPLAQLMTNDATQ